MWDVVVCTCQSTESALAIRNELSLRGISGDAVLLAVEDPKPNIGSGSATLNALLHVAEYLAAREGMTAVSRDVLASKHILVLHLGRTTFPYCPYGHGFMPHPSVVHSKKTGGFDHTELKTNLDELFVLLKWLCADTPPGVWVASTDVLFTCASTCEPLSHQSFESDSIKVFTVTCSPQYATHHGVCKISDTGEFLRIIHYGDMEQVKGCMQSDNFSEILAGLVYFKPSVVGTLLSLHTVPPLDACTYAGLDNGAEPLSLSLFFDILICLTTEVQYQEYVSGSFKTSRDKPTCPSAIQSAQERARAILWKALKGLTMKAVRLPEVQHNYLQFMVSDLLARYIRTGGEPCVINSLVPKGTSLGNNSLLMHCNLKTPISVGNKSFLLGLGLAFSEVQSDFYWGPKLSIPDEVTVQEIQVALGHGRAKNQLGIVVVYGIHDNLAVPMGSPGATFCNKPWDQLFQWSGITAEDLWLPGEPRTLLRARLFVVAHTSLDVGAQESLWLLSQHQDPARLQCWKHAWRISLDDILSHIDHSKEFSMLRDISFELQCQKMVKVLKENQTVSFLPFLRQAKLEARHQCVLETLDKVAEEVCEDPLVVCRVYASIADMLSYMAGEVGLRAGPAANMNWRSAFALLERGDLVSATRALAQERTNWIVSGPDHMIRASRHYERAGQILTRKAVATAKKFIQGRPCRTIEVGQRVTVYAPARVDIAGGWTDTPPQAYEWGGKVTTLALTLNGKYPIQVVAEKISELHLVLEVLGGDSVVVEELVLTELSQLANYSQPHAPGALLKAAFICAEIVEFPSAKPLQQQLSEKFGCGFKLQSMSDIPQGSGLGTSSILGGAILAALWKVAGQEHSKDSLIHAVLYLEQLLTTGGGWQDQCGGLYGGAKMSQSHKGLPVHILTQQLETPSRFVHTLNQHLMLVYTGKTRLARNLLQDVLRNWHSRQQQIVRNMQDLVDNAQLAAQALEAGDMSQLGACLDEYQLQKVIMAPGSLPKAVSAFVKSIRQWIYGCCLTGAGGGGFMTILCKDPDNKVKVQEVLQSNKEFEDFDIYDVSVDEKGLHYVPS